MTGKAVMFAASAVSWGCASSTRGVPAIGQRQKPSRASDGIVRAEEAGKHDI